MRIFPLSENAVTVEFGKVISLELNERAMELSRRLEQDRFQGYIESVPAYASTTVFYNVSEVRREFPEFPTAFDAVTDILKKTADKTETIETVDAMMIEVPARFDAESGPDLLSAASLCSMSVNDFLEIFTSSVYRVFMLGFLPGFAYMGEVDERIALPRLNTPRTNVPAGSIGIAGRQTGIYPFASPGGWQLIGRTDVPIFDIESDPPCYFEPGDLVRFNPV